MGDPIRIHSPECRELSTTLKTSVNQRFDRIDRDRIHPLQTRETCRCQPRGRKADQIGSQLTVDRHPIAGRRVATLHGQRGQSHGCRRSFIVQVDGIVPRQRIDGQRRLVLKGNQFETIHRHRPETRQVVGPIIDLIGRICSEDGERTNRAVDHGSETGKVHGQRLQCAVGFLIDQSTISRSRARSVAAANGVQRHTGHS